MENYSLKAKNEVLNPLSLTIWFKDGNLHSTFNLIRKSHLYIWAIYICIKQVLDHLEFVVYPGKRMNPLD